uniref:chromate transporter n=1 Tax=Ndongobacter massiliensis TaxID=1871025 RepID=UPI000931F67C|nr:chromate transporter [Ndongobacter massiliensis]
MKETENIQKRPAISLWTLFFTFLKINTFTFGGGYTIVPVIRDEFIQRLKLIDEDEMLDLVALAQSGPGPMAISTSLLTGYRVRGPFGAITCLIASVLPCLVIITLLFYAYEAVSTNPWAQAAFAVMGGVISAVLILTTVDMAKTALRKHRKFGLVLMIASFSSSYFFSVNTALIILFSGLIGLIVFSIVDEGRVH